jgi:hypothetical protein
VREQAFNEILQICAKLAKNDRALMQKLREAKARYSDG